MTDNPLIRKAPPTDGLLRLEQHVASLNGNNWVRASGKLYFINQRTKADGSIEHFVDRQA